MKGLTGYKLNWPSGEKANIRRLFKNETAGECCFQQNSTAGKLTSGSDVSVMLHVLFVNFVQNLCYYV